MKNKYSKIKKSCESEFEFGKILGKPNNKSTPEHDGISK